MGEDGDVVGDSAPGPPPPPLEWKILQSFGDRAARKEVQEVDIISAIKFDKLGDHLATGDRGGRVVLFDRLNAEDHGSRKDLERQDHTTSRRPQFRYKTEFQSHEPEFDYLKSLEIEEKINKIQWYQSTNGSLFLLSTNDKTIKFWKIASHERNFVSKCKRVYAHAHDYHINSISNNSDGETFISADDLRINLWNLEINKQCFNIVNIKPANMGDLSEVITSAEFHPIHCNTLAYSSSKGSIRLIDLRQSALCDTHSQLFEDHEVSGSSSLFTEIIASISDIKFTKDGRHILSRDYMTLKLWDINMNSGPVATFQVHEHLRPKLCDLYENDSISDKFECCLSGDGRHMATGSYSNLFRVFNYAAGSIKATTLEATANPMRRQAQDVRQTIRSLTSNLTRAVRLGSEIPGVDANGNSFDSTIKLLHLAWHPTENELACAAANSLFLYYA